MALALENDAVRIITIDGDLSHDPLEIPRLLEQEADIVLGSRYVDGSGIVGWPRRRRVISAFANGLVRSSLGTPERDLTTGFRAYTRRTAQIIVEESQARDYNFLVEAIDIAKGNQMSIAEVPITFRERLWGESKLSTPREAVGLFRLLAAKSAPFAFLVAGLAGALFTQLLLFFLAGVGGFHYLIAALLSIEAGILMAFALKEKWKHSEADPQGRSSRFLRHNLMASGGFFLNLMILFLLTEFVSLHYLISNVFGMGTALSLNYTLAFR